jgi:hypothetical protein
MKKAYFLNFRRWQNAQKAERPRDVLSQTLHETLLKGANRLWRAPASTYGFVQIAKLP